MFVFCTNRSLLSKRPKPRAVVLDIVPEVTKKQLFEGFWKAANFDVQNAFICGCVKIFSTK